MQGNGAEVIVVGGGLAGLTAAAHLARAGRSVELYESGALGGRAATQERGGFFFNEGPHALYCAGEGTKVLEELGVSFTGGVPGADGARAFTRGEIRDLPRSVATLATTSALSLGAKVEAGRVLSRLLTMDPAPLHRVTVAEWLRREVRSPEVANLVAALFRVSSYAHDPERMSFGSNLQQFQLGGKGVRYLDGGWQVLVEGLRGKVEAAGARIRTGRRVKWVERTATGFTVTDSEGETRRARAVVLAVRPSVAAALVKESAALASWAERAIPVRAACLDLGLRRLPNPKNLFALGLEEPVYFSVHTRSARLAPEGGAMIHVARYLGSEPPADPAETERELESLMDLGQPGWREEVVERRYLPNMIVANWLPAAASGGQAGRPGPAVPDVPGLFVAGDWVGPEGQLADTALASGRAAARLALEACAKDYAISG